MDESKIPPKPPDIEPFVYKPVCTISLPDPQQYPSSSEEMETSESGSRKRPAGPNSPSDAHPVMPVKLPRPATTNQLGRKRYSNLDKAPFIVHVSRIDTENTGSTLHHVKFGLFLLKNNIRNILPDGIKRLGRNRVAVEFKSPEDANAFLSNPILEDNKYHAVIPQFNVTRMGLVRGVPSDWSDEEVMAYVGVPSGCGEVLKVRRMNRRVTNDEGRTEWKPSQTVVLTFDGQILPKHIFCCYTALEVETYTYPTIQCYNCCRFGHTQTQCRSKPRCYKCSADHSGDRCDLRNDELFCINCNGEHMATSRDCPEYCRQRAIKLLMAEQALSYTEASKKLPPISRNYANAVKNTKSGLPTQPRPGPSQRQRVLLQTQPPTSPHRKTVFSKPRARSPPSPGYDRLAHQSLIKDYSFSPSQNGCALSPSQYSSTSQNVVPEDPIDQLVSLIAKLISSKSLPDHVASKLNLILDSLYNGPPTHNPTVELPEH